MEDILSAQPMADEVSRLQQQLQSVSSEKLGLVQDLEKIRGDYAMLSKEKAAVERERGAIDRELKKALAVIQKSKDQLAIKSLLEEVSKLHGEVDLLSDEHNQNIALKEQIHILIAEADAKSNSPIGNKAGDVAELLIFKTELKTLESIQSTLRQENTKLESAFRSLQIDFDDVKEALENERKKNNSGPVGVGKWWNRSTLMPGQTAPPTTVSSTPSTAVESNASLATADVKPDLKVEATTAKPSVATVAAPAVAAAASSVKSWWNRGTTATAPNSAVPVSAQPVSNNTVEPKPVAPAISSQAPLNAIGESTASFGADLSKQLEQLKMEKLELEEQLRQMSEEVKQLKMKESTHDQIQADLDSMTTQMKDLTTQLTQAETAKLNLLGQIDNFKVSESQGSQQALQKLAEIQSTLKLKEEEVTRLTEDLKESVRKEALLDSKIKEQEKEMRGQIQETEARLKEAQESHTRALQDLRSVSEGDKANSQQLIDLQNSVTIKETEIQNLKEQLKQGQSEESKLSSKISGLEAKIQAQIQEAQAALGEAQLAHKTAKEKLEEHIRSLTVETQTLKDSIASEAQAHASQLEKAKEELLTSNLQKRKAMEQFHQADLAKLHEAHNQALKSVEKKYEDKIALLEGSAKANSSSDSEAIQAKYKSMVVERDVQIHELSASIQAQLKDLKQKHEDQLSTIHNEHSEAMELLKNRLSDASAQQAALVLEKTSRLTEITKELGLSKQALSEKETRIAELSTAIKSFEDTTSQHNSLIAEQTSALASLKQEKEALTNAVSEKDSLISKKSSALEDAQGRLDALTKDMSGKEKLLTENLAKLEDLLEVSNKALSEKDSQAEDLQNNMQLLQSSIAQTSSGINKEQDQLNSLLIEKESKIAILENTLKDLAEAKDALQTERVKQETDFKEVSQQLERTQNELKTANEQLALLNQQVKELKDKLSQVSESGSAAGKDYEARISKLQQEIKTVTEEKISVEKSKKEVEDAFKATGTDSEARIKALTIQLVQLQSDKASAEKRLANEFEEKLKKESQTAEETRKKEAAAFEVRLMTELAGQDDKFKKEKFALEESGRKEKASSEEKFKKAKAELEDKAKKEKAELESNFTKEKQKLNGEIEAKKKEVTALEASKVEIQKKIDKGLADLEKAKKDATASDTAKTDAAKKLEKDLAAKNDELSKTQQKIKGLEQDLNNLKSEHKKALEASEKKVADLETDFVSRSQEHEKLQQEHPQLVSQISTLKEQVTNIQAQFDISSAELEVLKGSYERSSKAVTEKDEALKKIKGKVEEVIKSEKLLKKTISDHETERAELQSQVKSLKAQVAQLQASIEEQAALALANDKSKEMQAEIDSLRTDNDALKQKIEEMEGQYKITERKTFTIIKDLQKQLRKEVKHKEGLEDKADSLDGASTHLKSASSTLDQKSGGKPISQTGVPKMERLTDDLIHLVSENEALNKRARAAEHDLKALQDRYARVHEELEIKSKTIQQFVLRDHAAKLQPEDQGPNQKPSVFNMNILSSASAMQKMDPVKLSSINVKLQKLVEELTIKMNRMEGELQRAKTGET